jgi:acetylornithine deacetylase
MRIRDFLAPVASFSLLIAAAGETHQKPLTSPLRVGDREQALLDLHKLLVDTESISGNEHLISVRLTDFLRAHNFTVEHQELPPYPGNPHRGPRKNVFAYRGTSRETRILLTSHIDTVPPFYPWELRGKHNDEIWGRGSVDAKACVATQIAALMDLLESGSVKDDDVALLFVNGEEVGGIGMKEANKLGVSWESVIFGEPTEHKLASGHKGTFSMSITAHGKAGHSGYPWLGENANQMLLPALVELLKLELPSSEKYGNTTVNIGKLDGGVAANVIAEKSFATIQYRLATGEVLEVQDKLLRTAKRVDNRLEVDFTEGYGPVPCDTDIDGFETITVNYGTDIPWLHGDHKRYLYGPGSILVAHSDHEHLTVQGLLRARHDYKRIILGALSK